MTGRVGFVGVGTMGKLMAINLLKRHYQVTAFDLNPAPVEELLEFGAERAGSSAEAAAASEVVITMLPSSPHVEEAVLGPGGVLEGMRPGSVLIDMSTIDPLVSRRVAEQVTARGFRMLDAPVSGGLGRRPRRHPDDHGWRRRRTCSSSASRSWRRWGRTSSTAARTAWARWSRSSTT